MSNNTVAFIDYRAFVASYILKRSQKLFSLQLGWNIHDHIYQSTVDLWQNAIKSMEKKEKKKAQRLIRFIEKQNIFFHSSTPVESLPMPRKKNPTDNFG